ncbi:MAG: nucleotidyltransferase family protein [Candidatus Eremiobacteraeota bacterium]|nr:nucleotidyltransferase family protein [Candidatus Eremiobacteraeota bacterium]
MTTAVILAAGTGARFGGQKLLASVDGIPMLALVLHAVSHLPIVVVAGPDLSHAVGANVRFIENTAPDRGMAHSLRLAHAATSEGDALLVLLADMPYMTTAIVDTILAAAGSADICYPIRDGVGGHPVYFSRAARAKIPSLPDGDTLKLLRDDPSLAIVRIELADDGAYRDVDTRADLTENPKAP